MSVVVQDITVLHVPRTGGTWRRVAALSAVYEASSGRPHIPASTEAALAPIRDPVDWLSSFCVHLCASGTGWEWPWFHAAVDLYGIRPLALAECLVYRPKRWKSLVARKCRRWDFDKSIIGRGLCDGFLESGLFAMDWIRCYMAGGARISVFDFRESRRIVEDLVCRFGGRLEALDQIDPIVNSVKHDHGASFSEDMVREIYRQHAKANL